MHGNMGVKRPEKLLIKLKNIMGQSLDVQCMKSQLRIIRMRMRWSDYGIIIQML